MKHIRVLIIALAICLCLIPVIGTVADFGGFSGDSDFGGWDSGSSWGSDSSWGSGSSWDSDSSWGSGSSWDSDSSWGSDSSWNSGSTWGAGTYSGGISDFVSGAMVGSALTNDSSNDEITTDLYGKTDSSSGSGFFSFFFIIIIIVLIVFFIVRALKKKKQEDLPHGAARTDASQLTPISEYTNLDPNFSLADFQTKISNLYVQMQNAWTAKDISTLRPYFTDAYYAQMDRQLDALRSAGCTNYVDKISVLGTNVRGYFQQGNEDHIIVELSTRITDYTLNDATGKVVSGSQSKEKFMTYEFDLSRESGMKTSADSGMHTVNCPNCGAPLDINTTTKCPYCGSIVTVKEHDWAINNIKGISQKTV